MNKKLIVFLLALTLALPLAACTPNVPETTTPTPHVTATPGGAMDDLKDAGEDLKDAGEDMAKDIGDAARKVTDDVKNGVSRALN